MDEQKQERINFIMSEIFTFGHAPEGELAFIKDAMEEDRIEHATAWAGIDIPGLTEEEILEAFVGAWRLHTSAEGVDPLKAAQETGHSWLASQL